MEVLHSVTMGDCETGKIHDSRPLNPMEELDLKSEGRQSQPNPYSSGLIKAVFVLGCLLFVTSTLLAILEAPRHHHRVYAEGYSNSHVPRQEYASLLLSEDDNKRQGIAEQKGNSENGVFSAANETVTLFQD